MNRAFPSSADPQSTLQFLMVRNIPEVFHLLANTFVKGKEWPNVFGGGPEANNFLIARGFDAFTKTRQRIGVEAIDENEESTFPEGRILYRKHRARERDSKIARLAKNRRLQQTGTLACDACGFTFSKIYGDWGVGFIGGHHTIPISKLAGRRKTYINEIALVCPNCHRMVHWTRPWLTIKGLQKIIHAVNSQSIARPCLC